MQGEAMAAQAAVLIVLAAAVWLLRPARRTYLIDWYSFRPPERCAEGPRWATGMWRLLCCVCTRQRRQAAPAEHVQTRL